MTDYPQRNLTGLVIGNFAYKNETDQLLQWGTVLLISNSGIICNIQNNGKTKSITDKPYFNTPEVCSPSGEANVMTSRVP